MCYNGLGRRSFLNHVCFFRISAHFKMSYRMTTTRIMYGFIVKKRFGCSVLFSWNEITGYLCTHQYTYQFYLNQLSMSIYNCCINNSLQDRRLGNAKVCTRAKKAVPNACIVCSPFDRCLLCVRPFHNGQLFRNKTFISTPFNIKYLQQSLNIK